MRWRNIGPHRAGRTKAAAGHASQPYTFYIGMVNGGVWKTTVTSPRADSSTAPLSQSVLGTEADLHEDAFQRHLLSISPLCAILVSQAGDLLLLSPVISVVCALTLTVDVGKAAQLAL